MLLATPFGEMQKKRAATLRALNSEPEQCAKSTWLSSKDSRTHKRRTTHWLYAKSASIFIQQARQFAEPQFGKLLAPMWNMAQE